MESTAATESSLPQVAAFVSMLTDELGAELVLAWAATVAKLQRKPGFARLVRYLLAVAVRDRCNSWAMRLEPSSPVRSHQAEQLGLCFVELDLFAQKVVRQAHLKLWNYSALAALPAVLDNVVHT